MAGYKCLFCNEVTQLNDAVYRERFICWEYDGKPSGVYIVPSDRINVEIYLCPNCEKKAIKVTGGYGGQFQGLNRWLAPTARIPSIASEVPPHIYQDYSEACSIVSDSPKASATMSRRCLQGMIRDFWGIEKSNLHLEIKELSGKVDDEVVDALLAFKSIGNIGAHPDRNSEINLLLEVGDDEAESLLEAIEFLVDDWYVARRKKIGLFEKLRKNSTNKEKIKNQSSDSANN